MKFWSAGSLSLLTAASLSLFAGCMVGDADTGGDSTAGSGLSDDDKNGGNQGIGSFAARVCADGAVTKGVDVSYYQGNIDWTRVKGAGIQFAFIRVSDGDVFQDPKFGRNWTNAKAAGVVRGAYQFFRPNQSVTEQADLMVEAVGSYEPGDLPPVLDVEATGGQSPSAIAAKVGQWSTRVQQKLGVMPIIYTGKYFWRDQVGGSTKYEASPLWIAQYTNKCPDLPSPWTRWTFWQNSDRGTVPGIPGKVDTDQFNGTLDDLLAFANAGGMETHAEALPFSWTQQDDGSYMFTTAPGGDVASIEVRVDDYLIGTADNSGGAADIDYTFSDSDLGRNIEVRGLSSSGSVVAVGNGLIDSTTDPEVNVYQTGDSEYEIGLAVQYQDDAFVTVSADGISLTDEESGEADSSRLAVRYQFSQGGDRVLEVSAHDSAGDVTATYVRTLHVR